MQADAVCLMKAAGEYVNATCAGKLLKLLMKINLQQSQFYFTAQSRTESSIEDY